MSITSMTTSQMVNTNASVDALASDFQQTYGYSASASQLMDFARRNSVAGSPSIFSVWNQLATGNNDVANPNASVASSLASDWTQNPVISSAKSYANGQNLLFQDSNNNVLGFNLGNDSAYQMTAQQFTDLVVPPSSTSSGMSIFPNYVATLNYNQIGLAANTPPPASSIFNVSPTTYYDQTPYEYTNQANPSIAVDLI